MKTLRVFFKNTIVSPLRCFFGDTRWLAVWTAVALIVPNVVLSITEPAVSYTHLTLPTTP